MRYTWRIFKYSKLIQDESDKLSHCKTNIQAYSQSIFHSTYDSQSIIKEEWVHIFMESNRLIEIYISNSTIEISLICHTPPSLCLTKLECIDMRNTDIKLCLKGRVLGFKYTKTNKKFQVTFFNINEADLFFYKFNEIFLISLKKDLIDKRLLEKFYKLFSDTKIEKEDLNRDCNKSTKELVKEFLDLVNK